MGAKKRPSPRKSQRKKKSEARGAEPGAKKTPKKLAEVAAGLADPEADTISLVRRIASALELGRVVEALDTGEEVMSAVRALLQRSGGRYTVSEAAEKAGLDVDQFRQLNLACGFADPGPDARVFTDEDIEVLQLFQSSTDVFGDDLALQNVRAIGSAMSRVADAFISSFAVYVGRQSTEGEFTDEDLARANEAAVGLLPGALRAMDVLLRRHLELKSREDFATGEKWEGVDAVDRSVGFCDLVGYTELSQSLSATRLAVVLRAFETTAADLITARGGQVVKLIGDEVMFVSSQTATAVDVALELAGTFGQGDMLPPVRCGLAAGRVIVREGDYHGPVVAMAARIVKLAAPGTVLAPRSVAEDLGPEIRTSDAGSAELKGFTDPVDLITLSR